MTPKKKVLVLTDHMPWGHRSIARAIFSYLKNKEKESDYKVYYEEVEPNIGLVGDLYSFIYRYMPSSNRIAHRFFENKTARGFVEEVSVMNLPKLKKKVEKLKPDLIISAYFFHSHSLVKLCEKTNQKFKLWNIVADPWTVNPITFVKGADLSLVYDEVAEKMAQKYGIECDKILKTGWWVRPEMYTKYDREKSRKKLGFNDDRPVIFVGGGSLGTNSLTRILPILMLVKNKVGVVFNTGTDKLGYNMVQEFIKLFKKLRKDDLVVIKNLGWIDNMAEVLSACDIVFGKAGPNFLFDVVATEKPFVAITHIGGQEDGNIVLIKRKKLGWIKEKNGLASEFLARYIKNPSLFKDKFKETIEKEAINNSKSLELVWEKANSI